MKRAHWLGVLGAVVVVVLPLALAAQEAKPKAESQPAEKPAASVSGTYQVDGVHSSNVFRIKHLNVAFFYGRFNEMEGTFVLDEADPSKCTFDVRLKTASIDTNHEGRDKHLRSPEFFDVEKNPEIAFKSTKVSRSADGKLSVTGDLTLRGVTKPMTAAVELTGAGKGMRGEFRAGFETTLTLQRSEFGMTALLNGLSDEVRITVSAEGVKQ
jgi:polyisoprenoid-binding protein YceI